MTPDPAIALVLAIHIAIGGTAAAWLHWTLGRWPGIGRVTLLWSLGPLALIPVALVVVARQLRRIRP